MTALPFDVSLVTAALLVLAVVLASARLLYRQWRAPPEQRSRAWRLAALLLAQPLCAVLLYFALLPPQLPGEAGALVVATAGATSAQMSATGDARVALPEAPALAGIERVPDLATALRRHPGTQRVRIVGAGLEPRDRDAAHGLALQFAPAPLPRGLVELAAPQRVVAGAPFAVGGRAEGVRGGFAELIDPGRQRVDRVALAGDGRFNLGASTRVAGASRFLVRLRDARQQIVEDVELPVYAAVQPAPRVLLLAGAPGPELKYLRRWARDAGLSMHTQIATGGGMQLGDAPVAIDAASLGRFDVAVLDERAWSALGEGQRTALTEAANNGLGVMLRLTAALSEPERRRLRAWGFTVDAGRDSATVQLALPTLDEDAVRARLGPGTRDAPRLPDAAVAEVPELSRRNLRIGAGDAVPLLRDQGDASLAAWRAKGRGRIALWTLTDSYRLVLAGRDDLYGEMWSDAFATLARAQASPAIEVQGEARQQQRIALCGLGATAGVTVPSGGRVSLLRDPVTGDRACAAFWPREAGWHEVRSGEGSEHFFVRAHDAAVGLHAGAMREATLQLAAERASATTTVPATVPGQPGERWPWWLAWLLASAALWWFERSRAGRSAQLA